MEARAMAKAPQPEIDINMDACEIECLTEMLANIKPDAIRMIAEQMPRSIPPKRCKSIKTMRVAILERWAHPEVRRYLQDFIYRASHRFRANVRDKAMVRQYLEAGVDPGTILYVAHLEGLDPKRMLASLPATFRRSFAERHKHAKALIEGLERLRERKVQEGRAATDQMIARQVASRTQALQERLADVSRKHQRAQSVVTNVAASFRQRVAALEGDLTAAHNRVKALEEINESQRETIEALKRHAASEAEELRKQGRHLLRTALSGMRVLVIGDDNHQLSYRETVEGFGGDFDFLSGFTDPRRAAEKAAGADLVVLVTSFVSHKISGPVDAVGRPVVRVNNGGGLSMREALRRYVFDLLMEDRYQLSASWHPPLP